MKPLRKTLRTTRTREDHELFRVSLTNYDPATVQDVIITEQPGHYLKPQQPFASIFFHFSAIRALGLDTDIQQGGFGQQLSTHISGTIERLGSNFHKDGTAWSLGKDTKKGSVELLYLRQCQHFLKKQSMENGNNKVNFNLSPGQVCPRCHKQVWIEASQEQENVTVEDLLRANTALQLNDLKQLEWTIIVNEQFTPTTVIAKVGEQEIYYPVLAKATYLLGQGQKPSPNGLVMRIRKVYCYHEKILERRCQFCLQQIDQEQLQSFNRYLFQYNSKGVEHSFTKGAALQQQEQEYITGLIAKKKLILILDLDNTILHSTEMSQLELAKVLKIREYFMIPKLEINSQGKLIRDYVMVKMRPYFRQFLFVVSKLFQVYVYTKGTRLYADEICKWIRYQWGGGADYPFDFPTWTGPRFKFIENTEAFLPYRVMSRSEDGSLDTKSMQNILPTRTEYHIILDDRRDVWANSPSWYYTRQYLYFAKKIRTGQDEPDVSHYLQSEENAHPFKDKLIDFYAKMRQDYPPKKEYEIEFLEKADNFLLFAAHTLKKMHAYFFEHLKQKTQNNKDGKAKKHPVFLSNIMQRLKLFLAPKKYRFFLAPDEKGVNMINILNRAQKMGAAILDEKSQEKPDLVIRSNNYIKYIRKYYANKNEPFPEIDFPYDEKLEKLITEPPVYKLELQEDAVVKEGQIPKEQMEAEPQYQIFVLPPPPEPQVKVQAPEQSPSEPIVSTSHPKKAQQGRDFKSQLRQLKNLARSNIPVISQTWVLACYEFSYRFRAEDFRLHDPTKEEVSHEDFNEIIDRAAEKIKKLIVDEMKEEVKGKSKDNNKGQSEKQISEIPREDKDSDVKEGDSKKREPERDGFQT